MRYQLDRVEDEYLYASTITNVNSSLYYHDSKWCISVVLSLLQETEGKNSKAVKWFVTNTAKAIKANCSGFFVSLNSNYYTRNVQKIGYRGVVSLLNLLDDMGYIDIYVGFVTEWDENGKPLHTVPSFVQFKEKYLALWDGVDIRFLPNLPTEDLVEVKDRKTGEIKSLKGRNGIGQIKEVVQMLNNSLKEVKIEFMGKRVAPVEYKRIYSNNLTECGRFFVAGGGIQIIPEKYRSKYLRFDGEPVVELDFSSIHPFICYERLNLGGGFDCNLWEILGEDFKPYDADTSMLNIDWQAVEDFKSAYNIASYAPVRNLCKQALLTSINAVDRTSAVAAVSSELLRDMKKAGTKDESKRKYVGLIPQVRVGELCDAIKEHNYIIEDFFFRDMGVKLMNTDSNITARVVETMVQQGESILCYHDSYICRASAEQMLYDAMRKAWKEEVGDNQFCKISKK